MNSKPAFKRLNFLFQILLIVSSGASNFLFGFVHCILSCLNFIKKTVYLIWFCSCKVSYKLNVWASQFPLIHCLNCIPFWLKANKSPDGLLTFHSPPPVLFITFDLHVQLTRLYKYIKYIHRNRSVKKLKTTRQSSIYYLDHLFCHLYLFC